MTKEMTLGLLHDLPVCISSSVFYLQVQVFENAPYEMLLSHPFLTLIHAQTHHYTNGDLHITLLDLNINETLTIPTRVQAHPPVPNNSGFWMLRIQSTIAKETQNYIHTSCCITHLPN